MPLILACPPAVDYHTYTPEVLSNGALSERVQATDTLNAALAAACVAAGIAFSGVDTWAFARTPSGSLKPELSTSGHSSIDPALCAPVHECLRKIILAAVPVASLAAPAVETSIVGDS